MTTIDVRPEAASGADDAAGSGSPSTGRLFVDWVTTVEHTRVGRLYVAAALLYGTATVVVGVLLGIEQIDTDGLLFEQAVPQMTSFYWYILAFGLAVPLLLGLAIAMVPLQIGAPSIAFPRAAASSFWGWFFGTIVMVGAWLSNGGPGGGEPKAVDLWLAGFVLVLASLCIGAMCVAATVISRRRPGAWLADVQPFTWASLVGATGLVITLPMVAARTLMLYVDHRYSRAAFEGNVGIAPNLDWSFQQTPNMVYAIAALGLFAELVPVAARRRLVSTGAAFAGIALVGLSIIGVSFQSSFALDLGNASFMEAVSRLLIYWLTLVVP